MITTPSSRTCLFQVSTFVNQFSGGGLVEPRRNAGIMRKRTDSPSGMSGWIQRRSPACRLGTREIGSVFPARVTLTSILGPARSKAAVSARSKPPDRTTKASCKKWTQNIPYCKRFGGVMGRRKGRKLFDTRHQRSGLARSGNHRMRRGLRPT